MMISRRKMLSQSFYIAIGSLFVPISTAFTTSKSKHLSKGLDLIHKVLSRPLDVGILHLDKCLVLNEVDIEKHDGFKDYINSLVNVFSGHHDGEDEIMFPTFEKKIKDSDFSKLKEQHKKLHPLTEQIKNKVNIDSPTINNYKELRDLLQETKDLWVEHREEEEKTVELDLEPLFSSKEQIELTDKLGKHGQSMSKPATLILPFLIYNLESNDRAEFTSDMPWILKKFVVPVIWKKKWEKMKPFLLV
mgnify:CR=1 FL=1